MIIAFQENEDNSILYDGNNCVFVNSVTFFFIHLSPKYVLLILKTNQI